MNIVQFSIARDVADVLDVGAVKTRARRAGIGDVRFGYNEKDAGGKMRITCSVRMAIFIIEELRVCAAEAEAHRQPDLLIHCAHAVAAAFAAIEAGDGGATTKPVGSRPRER